MNITKTKLSLKKAGEKVGGKCKTAFSRKNLKRNLVVLASVAIIGGAVFLNWNYFSAEGSSSVGGAQSVLKGDDNVSAESYFAMTEVSRQKTRDEAMEVLQTIVDNEATGEEDRAQALNSINEIAKNIQYEGNIESLVVSKGFDDCVAVISDGVATVVVKSDGLLENEITQIQEIVYTESGILPQDLRIIEKSQ
ncbi:MAG: SpoIIIAH-like family protein [Clostridia bacterium]|nr:SpoIIIAH-like family protein [Clostridia bacterium]